MFENKVTEMVAKATELLSEGNYPDVAESLKLDNEEWFAFGEWPTRAMMENIIDRDEAQSLYSIHSRYHADATIAERYVYLLYMQNIGKALFS